MSDIWYVSGGYLKNVSKDSSSLDILSRYRPSCDRKNSEYVSQERLRRVKSGQGKLGQVKLGQVK